ncbi:MAG: M23 family metallopeptidase [Candidatus Acidiferrales bacterium]
MISRYFASHPAHDSHAGAWSPSGARFAFSSSLLLMAILLLGVFPSPSHAQASASGPDISGSWTGALGAGENQLHVVLTITKAANGEFAGQLNSVDQGAVLPMDSVTVQGQTVRFEVKAIGGVYEGTLNADRTKMTGTWTQANVPPQPLSVERAAQGSPARAAKEGSAAAAASGPKERPITIPLDVVVPIAPTAFKADGKVNLVYELHVVNMGRWDCTLNRVDVVSSDSAAKSLGSFSGATLEGMIERPGLTVTQNSKLAPGTEAVVFLWLSVDRPADVPAAIRQRLTVKIGDYPEELTLETNPLPVHTGPIVITPPLRGDHWVAANGPSNTSGHRRALIPIDGRAVISQRFAIDWVKLGDDGKTYHGDKLDNKNYYAFGVDALAVADGVVTEVKDGIPLNVPGENSRAVPITLETVGGNHVILNIGNGNFAFYAHLQPGSIRVKLGEKVHRGQVLGLVGNTGNSTEPHLHFHISNASSPLGSEGLPYLLRSFEVEGKGWTWKPSDEKGAPEKHTMEIPTENEVVRFPSAP